MSSLESDFDLFHQLTSAFVQSLMAFKSPTSSKTGRSGPQLASFKLPTVETGLKMWKEGNWALIYIADDKTSSLSSCLKSKCYLKAKNFPKWWLFLLYAITHIHQYMSSRQLRPYIFISSPSRADCLLLLFRESGGKKQHTSIKN